MGRIDSHFNTQMCRECQVSKWKEHNKCCKLIKLSKA